MLQMVVLVRFVLCDSHVIYCHKPSWLFFYLLFSKTLIMDALLISLIVFYVILAIFAICAVAAFSLHQEGSPGLEQDIELQEHPVI